jgi:Ca2+-binding RTX toxin-like protein
MTTITKTLDIFKKFSAPTNIMSIQDEIDTYEWKYGVKKGYDFETEYRGTSNDGDTNKFPLTTKKGGIYTVLTRSYDSPSFVIYDEFDNIVVTGTSAANMSVGEFNATYNGTYYVEVTWDTAQFKDSKVHLAIYEDTANVILLNNKPTGEILITGIPEIGQKLTVTNTIQDADGMGEVNYKWYTMPKIQQSGTGSSRIFQQGDELDGGIWAVLANYTDGNGTKESVISNFIYVKPAPVVIETPKPVVIESPVFVISTKPTSGNDEITGTSKADKLSALAGTDTLSGGLGADTLTGGSGSDVFKFNNIKETGITSKTSDTITDFKSSEGDKINLSDIDANTNRAGNQSFLKFDIGAKFSGEFTSTGQLFFDTTTQILWGNVDTKAGADFSIKLSGVSSLVIDDFVL